MASQNKQMEALKARNEALATKVAEQEAQIRGQAATPKPTEDFSPRLYWARAKKYRIANYVPEKKTAGNIDQREISIQFEEHVRIARTLHEAEYIEGHDGYGIECWKVKDMEEANARTFKQDVERGQAREKPITTAVMDDVDSPKERQKMAAEAVASQ